jgi:endonuclease YncB( thermonuclease family)
MLYVQFNHKNPKGSKFLHAYGSKPETSCSKGDDGNPPEGGFCLILTDPSTCLKTCSKRIYYLVSILGVIGFTSYLSFAQPPPPPFYDEIQVPVMVITDGDTFVMNIGNKSFIVEPIGVDAPETNPLQCYGMEAQSRAMQLLTAKMVKLEADPALGKGLINGRLLRYIWVDGKLFNYLMIREGFAKTFSYETPYNYQIYFFEAEEAARQEKRGIWRACEGR